MVGRGSGLLFYPTSSEKLSAPNTIKPTEYKEFPNLLTWFQMFEVKLKLV